MAEAKKYQVFISSTYLDLRGERKAVEEVIIRSGDFPVGMEAFPAADEEQFEFIKSIIDSCDYYVLIVAGRYGSLASGGKSYTEKEYLYAVEKRIPVLVMVHGQRDSLAGNKIETTDDGRRKLEEFIGEISKNRMRKDWTTTDGLKLAVREALDHAKATKPRYGWIRGDAVASQKAVQDLLNLQEENSSLRKKIENLQPSSSLSFEPAGFGALVNLSGYANLEYSTHQETKYNWQTEIQLVDIFSRLAPHLLNSTNEISVRNIIGTHFRGDPPYGNFVEDSAYIDQETLLTLRIQLEAIALLSVCYSKTTGGGYANFWKLTERGKKEMMELRVIPKDQPTHPSSTH